MGRTKNNMDIIFQLDLRMKHRIHFGSRDFRYETEELRNIRKTFT